MNHTPGPWRAEFAEDGGYDCMTAAWHISGVVGGGWPAPIATIDLNHYGQSARKREIPEMSRAHAEADARLIAAAPDGFELAKLVVDYFGNDILDPMLDADNHLRDTARALIAKVEGAK